MAASDLLATVPWASDFAAAVAAHSALPCVTDAAGTMTFGEVAARAGALAHLLRARGLTPGTPVAISLRNGATAMWASIGLRLAGVAETALNDGLGEAERRYCLTLSGARLVVTTHAQAAPFAALGCEILAVEEVPDGPADLAALPAVPGAAHGRISFTSGTTGAPKAIVQTHAARWIGNVIQQASHMTAPGPGSSILLMTPFVHGAGILSYAFMLRGARSVILDGVQTDQVEALLSRSDIDHIFAPPTVLAKITAALGDRTVPGIRMIFCGTAPLLPPLYRRAEKMFGPVIRVTYGKTEINNPITALSPAQCDAYYASGVPEEGVCVGFPGTGVEVEIRDEHGARAGDVGEVHLRGRHMASGHIDANGFQPLPPDGFHATGDLGRIDGQGRLHLVGRLADVVKSGGYKIHPDEIERALAGVSARAATVVSLPSEYWGEVIVAVAEGADADWEAAARDAVAPLARYKHPRAYVVLPSLPRNAQGKVMRRLIRAEILERFRLVDGRYPTLEPR